MEIVMSYRTLALAAACSAALSACVVAPVGRPYGPYSAYGPAYTSPRTQSSWNSANRDYDRDGIPNRYDRDANGDGVPDRYQGRP